MDKVFLRKDLKRPLTFGEMDYNFGLMDDLSDVAFSGDYDDLSNKPTIPENLGDLDDIDLTDIQDGYILYWDNTTSSYKFKQEFGGIVKLGDEVEDFTRYSIPYIDENSNNDLIWSEDTDLFYNVNNQQLTSNRMKTNSLELENSGFLYSYEYGGGTLSHSVFLGKNIGGLSPTTKLTGLNFEGGVLIGNNIIPGFTSNYLGARSVLIGTNIYTAVTGTEDTSWNVTIGTNIGGTGKQSQGVVIGALALVFSTLKGGSNINSGHRNTFIGQAVAARANGGGNVAVGNNALSAYVEGNSNVAIGFNAGNSSNANNAQAGTGTGFNFTNSVFLGRGTITNGAHSNLVMLGVNITGDASNKLIISNLIYGVSTNDTTGTAISNGRVGIRNNNPDATLHVNGNVGTDIFKVSNYLSGDVFVLDNDSKLIHVFTNTNYSSIDNGYGVEFKRTANTGLRLGTVGTFTSLFNSVNNVSLIQAQHNNASSVLKINPYGGSVHIGSLTGQVIIGNVTDNANSTNSVIISGGDTTYNVPNLIVSARGIATGLRIWGYGNDGAFFNSMIRGENDNILFNRQLIQIGYNSPYAFSSTLSTNARLEINVAHRTMTDSTTANQNNSYYQRFSWHKGGAAADRYSYMMIGSHLLSTMGFQMKVSSDAVNFVNGNLALNPFGGNVAVGFATAPTATLHLKGQSSIDSFRVDSDTVNNALLVNEDGEVTTKLFKWTIDLMGALTIDLVADENFKINSITNIKSSPTVTIEVNGNPYTLGNNITIGDDINISVNINNSVIKLNCELI